jgi:hypothetical protein
MKDRKDEMGLGTSFTNHIRLENDEGSFLEFEGRSYAKTSFFDENTGVLTQQELFTAGPGKQAFSIVATDGDKKDRRAYMVTRDEDSCVIDNGEQELSLPFDSLMAFARTLIEIEDEKKQQSQSGQDVQFLRTVNE